MENQKEVNTPDNSVPRPVDVAGGEGGGNDSEIKSLAEVMNETLGTNFKDDTSALEGLKETAKFRGKLNKYRPYIEQLETKKGGENQALEFIKTITMDPEVKPEVSMQAASTPSPTIDTSKFISTEKYEQDMYFTGHPEYQGVKGILTALKSQNPSKSWEEVTQMEEFKDLYGQAKEAEELKSSRQPLVSSSRVYQNPDASYEEDIRNAKGNPEKMAEALIRHGKVVIPPGMEDIK